MAEKLSSRFKRAWNVFFNKDPTLEDNFYSYGGSSYRPDRPRLSFGNERSIIASIYNRISTDAASMDVKHIRVDDNDRYVEEIKSGLDNCLTVEANIDQTGRAFVQDIVFSMLDEGCVAVIPIDIDSDSKYSQSTSSADILTMRTGKILDWYPDRIRASVYNELTGEKEEIIVKKSRVAIIENPFYSIMNEPNSTLQRLIRKLNLLDVIDNQNGSDKMDLIIQLPYTVRGEIRQKQADKRKKDLEDQLANSKYGIAYIDAAEHITQLNRAVESNLMPQIEYLTNTLYGQLGLTPEILNGSADEQVMKNYTERTISPIMSAITEEMERKFLSKTARTQNQAIRAFNDPFKMIPTSQIAEMADKLSRNEILSSNEIRQVIGIRPSDDPAADELRNKNLNRSNEDQPALMAPEDAETDEEVPLLSKEEYDAAMADLDSLDAQLKEMSDELDDELKHYASKYYDPVKAHEYYEKTKQLKGRKSTAGLNDEGKSAAKYVKEQLSSERKSKTETAKDDIKQQISAYSEKTNQEIKRLRTYMKSKRLNDDERLNMRTKIAELQADNTEQRAKLQAAYKETAANLKTEYDSKYEEELAKIQGTSSFQKQSKSKTASTQDVARSEPKLYTGEEYERRLKAIKDERKKEQQAKKNK